MTNNDSKPDGEIGFDANSGISEEEQKEILAKINGITESRRRELAASAEDGVPGKKRRFKAKKSGIAFPALVNIAAIAALIAGFFVFSSFQGKTDTQMRIGPSVYNSAERALIDEIRKETSSRLEAKENEISTITSQLEEIDSQLRGLHSNNQELTEDQQATEDRLKMLQDEYRAALAALQDEKSGILEEARAREAVLQTQLESRTRELAVTAEQSSAAIELALDEMERLSREQAQVMTVEAQMGAFFSNLHDQINENRLDDALQTVQSMRNFLNTPVFMSLRSIRERRDMYNRSIDAFESMIEEAVKNQAALAVPPEEHIANTIASLQEKNDELEEIVKSLTSEGSGNSRRLADLQRTVTARDKTIGDLRGQLTTRDGTIRNLQGQVSTRDGTIRNLEGQVNTGNNTIGDLRGQVDARDTTIGDLRGQVDARDGTIGDLREQVSTRNDTIGTLQRQVDARNTTISNVQEMLRGADIANMSFNQLQTSLEEIRQALGN